VELRIQILEVKLAKVALVDSGPPLNANIRNSFMSAFGSALDVHPPLAFVAVQASGLTFSGFRAFLCPPFWADGVEDGNHHSKVSSGCEIILKLKPKCRYSRRVRSGAEGVSGAPCRGRFSSRRNGPGN
jgi:hypothetical protein